jgi:hypothetical protein
MSTTVTVKITEIDDIYTNAYSSATKLAWINTVESLFFTQYVKKWVKGKLEYPTVSGYNEVMRSVRIDDATSKMLNENEIWEIIQYNGNLYQKVDSRWVSGNLTYYFYIYGENICLFPAPTVDGDFIDISYLYEPTKMVVENIETDTLLIPDAFNEVYNYYCIYRMKQVNQEDDAVNWYDLFSAKMQEYANFYNSTAPMSPPQQVISVY